MGKKKKQTIGYKYYASGHLVLCHGPVDGITKISFQDKDAYLNEENANKTIYINKPSLFGGDEQSGGVQGNIELLFGRTDQQKSSTLQRICAKISDAFSGLISAYRGVCSVVFDNVYIGTAPNMPDSKWRVKRIHTRHDGQVQWYDEKAEINFNNLVGQQLGPTSGGWKYKQAPLTDSLDYSLPSYDDENWSVGRMPFASASGQPYAEVNGFPSAMGTYWALNTAIWLRKKFTVTSKAEINLEIFIDNVADVWVNGSQLVNSVDTTQSRISFSIPSNIIKIGENLIVLRGRDDAATATGDFTYAAFKLDQSGSTEADINPAHIIRECLTNAVWGIGVAESNIDDSSFKQAADTLYDEQMGMSIKWTDSTSINEFVDNIKEHINAQLYLDRVTNKWKLYLIRYDYNVSDLISLNEGNIRNLDFERRTLAECVNAVTVTYWDRERAKESTVTVQDIARIAQQGGVISQSIDYKGFTNSDLASRVALRDLKTLSSTLASVSFDVDESFSESWHEGMPFKLSDESYGLSEAVMRIRTIKRGDGINNAVYVEAIEDSFSSPMQSVVEYVPPITSGDSTAKNATAIAFEMPYIELVEQYGQDEVDQKLLRNPELSYVGMAAIRPNNLHVNANLYANSGAGYDEKSTLDFCPNATLKADIGYLDTAFEIANVAEFGLLQENHRLQIDAEFVAFVGYDSTTNILTVKRGIADTVPAKHLASAKIYGWDNYSGLDETEYSSGETVDMKALTLTGSDILTLSEATTHSVTCVARAIRPYPPANVKINGEYYPDSVESSITVTWVNRNRLQQTGASYLAWTDGGVSIESGVETIAELYALVGSQYVLKQSYSTQNSTLQISLSDYLELSFKIILYTKRSETESYQKFEHVFASSLYSPTNVFAVSDQGTVSLMKPKNIIGNVS